MEHMNEMENHCSSRYATTTQKKNVTFSSTKSNAFVLQKLGKKPQLPPNPSKGNLERESKVQAVLLQLVCGWEYGVLLFHSALRGRLLSATYLAGVCEKINEGKGEVREINWQDEKENEKGRERSHVCGKAENDWDAPGNDSKVLPMFCKYLREQTALGKRN